MRILYFIEPREELGKPLFRLGTMRNHVSNEVLSLSKMPGVGVKVLTSTQVFSACLDEKLLPESFFIHLDQDRLKKIYPEGNDYGINWYRSEYSPVVFEKMSRLLRKVCRKFVPDVVICYEASAPYIQEAFPDALIINSSLGMLSRAPYPELGCLDPIGVYGKSFLTKYSKEILAYPVRDSSKHYLDDFRNVYSQFFNERNPVSIDDVRGGYKKVYLLPMQVSGYFAFDGCLPSDAKINNQVDLIMYVLERVPTDVAIYVTLHGAEADSETQLAVNDLQSIYPNLIFNPNIQRIKWCSQWVIPYVDGVIAVSSSVGMQAVLYRKPIFVVGQSQLSLFSSGDLSSVGKDFEIGDKYDGAIYYMLTRYYPSIKECLNSSEWFYKFLFNSVRKKNEKGISFDFFDPIGSDEVVFSSLKNLMQIEQTYEDLERSASHMTLSRIVDVAMVKAAIESADVISFDVFDTLITRNLVNPNHVFDLMNKDAEKIFSSEGVDISDFGGFRNLRERAANRVLRSSKAKGFDEIIFKDIYAEIKQLTSLSKESVLELRKLEIRTELSVMNHRALGVELFRYAKTRGKIVILVSDMYLDTRDIVLFLKKNGISNFDNIFVSSEFLKLKKTGDLFDVVKSEYPGRNILHLGDNHLSDVLKPISKGLRAIHLPIITETYLLSAVCRDLQIEKSISESLGESLMHGVISRRFYDNTVYEQNWFDGSCYRLGYEACGSILLGFSKWIMEQAIRDGVKDLYFLARDGFLVKRIYDLISVGVDGAPKSHYLLASRRCYSTAALFSEQDLLDSLSMSFSKVSVEKILEARYGVSVDELREGTLSASGISSFTDVLDIKRKSHLNKFKRLLAFNSEVLLERAGVEREALLIYLSDMGISKNSNSFAVVDIGHNASLQRCLGRILDGRVDIGGYYFMTYHGAKTVFDEGFDVKGYLSDFEDSKLSSHPYCKNIGMFEFLFLPSIPSFKRFNYKSGKLHAEYVGGDESARFSVIDQVHKGVEDYVSAILSAVRGDIRLYDVSKNKSLKTYVEFIQNPYPDDARMLDALSFVDQFGGSDARYLIATPKFSPVSQDNFTEYLADSWWREGAKSLVSGRVAGSIISKNKDNIVLKMQENHISVFQRKLRKLRANPKGFMMDSKFIKLFRRGASA